MEPSTDSLEPENKKGQRASTIISAISLVVGFLGVLPYLSLMLFYLVHDLYGYQKILGVFGDLGLGPGFICGVPGGLTAIILGIIGLVRKPRRKRNVILVIIGILLGIFGIIGHYWYFATCQFCQ